LSEYAGVIYWKYFLPGAGDISWCHLGEKIWRGEKKIGENVKEKGRKVKEKGRKGKEKEEMGKKKKKWKDNGKMSAK
jgi:hypothetical protein